MNILKILGIVVAVHVVAFFLMFVNPGCRSTSQRPTPAASDTTPMAAPVTGGQPDLGPAPAPAVSVDLSPPPVVRYSPTRPNTPAAEALESTPPANVTPATTYAVVAGDSLWKIAKRNGTTVAELSKANRLTSNSRLSVGQKLIIPGKAPAAGEGGGGSTAGATYVVKSGDTLSSIARRVGTTSAALRHANNLTSDYVRVGQELRLPTEGSAAAMTPAAAEPAAAPAAPTKKADGSVVHVVKAGETLGAIARKYQVKVSDLAIANNIADPKKIRPGQELVVPGYTAPGGATLAAQSAASAPGASAATTTPAAPAETAAPPPEQDLDSGLKPQDNVPVIKIEDNGAAKSP